MGRLKVHSQLLGPLYWVLDGAQGRDEKILLIFLYCAHPPFLPMGKEGRAVYQVITLGDLP